MSYSVQPNSTPTTAPLVLALACHSYIKYIMMVSGLWIGCSPFTQEVVGSTPTGGTCPNDSSDPIDQDILTQCALRRKIVVSEWRSMIAVSLNVDARVRLKPAKLYMCMQNTTNTTRTDGRHRVCAAMVPYR